MRIVEAHLYARDLPVRDGPYTMAGQTIHALDTTLVRLVSDTGLDGWGEVCPLGSLYAPVTATSVRAVLEELCSVLPGCAALPRPVAAMLDETVLAQPYAKAAIDIAVHDLLGKALGVPVAALLGGALADRLPSYYAIGLGSPEETARAAVDKVAEGYPRIQLKIGGRNVAEDVAAIHKTWEAIGNRAQLVVDANRGMTTAQALRLSQQCKAIPMIVEQPCATLQEIAAIRTQLHHPLFLDESAVDLSTVASVASRGLCDGFGMKISRLGGLQAIAAVRDLAAACNLPMTCEDGWGGDITAAACIHAGATFAPRRLEGVWLATPYLTDSYLADGQISVRDGHVTLPQGAGLGVAPDPDRLGPPTFSTGG